MAVNYKRTDYQDQLAIWTKCRDVAEGQEQVHAQGTLYLAMLQGQTPEEYKKYVGRASLYNATSRTIDAMSGMLFRKDPLYSVPPSMMNYLYDIDMQGNTLNNFVEKIADEVIMTGRVGVLVEHPQIIVQDSTVELTKADAEIGNLRPFVAQYKTEDIINWNYTTRNNVKILSLVVLREVRERFVDTFEPEYDERFRVLKFDENGQYMQEIWLESTDSKIGYYKAEEVFPMIQGQRFNMIPFFFITPKGIIGDIVKPPILDLVNINLSHYKTTADIEHAAHYTALPTPVITGHKLSQDNKGFKIGSSEVWVLPEAEARISYLEYAGTGLNALEMRINKKEEQMAALGARMLSTDKNTIESADTHNIKRQGENSALGSIAAAISDGVTKLLSIMATWLGEDNSDIYYLVNKDFVPSTMSPQTLTALLQAYQSGAIAFSDFVAQLQKGEVISVDRTPEMIMDEIENSGILAPELNDAVV